MTHPFTHQAPSNVHNLTGQKFNLLTVVGFLEVRKRNARWACVCDCGKETVVGGTQLKNGDIRSCGCLLRQYRATRDRAAQRKGNNYIARGTIVEIHFGDGRLALIDKFDLAAIQPYTWFTHKTLDGMEYVHTNMLMGESRKMVTLHRFLIKPPAGMVVDHKDHDGMNNCRNNLRVCSPKENSRNSLPQKSSKGVCFHKQSGKWMARIKVDKKAIYLGLHTEKAGAQKAYNEAAKKHFGEFACTVEA